MNAAFARHGTRHILGLPESDSLSVLWPVAFEVVLAGRDGVRKFEALLGLSPLHRARDLIREDFIGRARTPDSAEYLALTYTMRVGANATSTFVGNS